MRRQPYALAIFGNLSLVASAVAVLVVIARRRREWAGCQRLFWDTLGIGIGLWVIGHFGWAADNLLEGRVGWLRWHTLFSLCGGIGPMIALLARPHRGVRPEAVNGVGLLLASFGLLAAFIYSHFVLVPSLVLPEQEAQWALLAVVQVHRATLAIGMLAAVWAARHTAWHIPYAYLAVGASLGFFLRLVTSRAISLGSYQAGTIYDLAWIAPFLCYAWAAHVAPASSTDRSVIEPPVPMLSAAWAAVPVLLIPLIGYTTIWLQPLGITGDSFRALLTALLTVAGLGILTLRLGIQGSELQRAEARMRLLAAATERTGDLILITRADGQFEHANEAFVRTTGFTRDQLAGKSFGDLLQTGLDHLEAHIHSEVRARGVWRGTLHRSRSDGGAFPASCTIVALHDASGRITHFVGVERDITEEIRLRDQLVHTERLSAIGELVAGVAHEINNPLQTVLGSVELMLEDAPHDGSRKDLEAIRREASRAAQIVRNLLSFVRRTTPDRQPVDLNAIVRDAVDLRQFSAQQKGIRFDLQLAPAPQTVLASHEELQQVVLNLLLNAEQALGRISGHSIVVSTYSDGRQHTLDVADDGPGVSEELRGRIFEPFFTTKPVGEGTGLGLSISHGIASAHGGTLELIPSTRGATFRLQLPAFFDVSASAPAPAARPATRLRRALVVDDEVGIRRLLLRLLAKRGYDVIEAETGEAAIAAAAAIPVNVVLCDVRMPGMTGVEIYKHLAQVTHDPRCAFVFMTGDRASIAELTGGLEHVPVLAKPFTGAELDAILGRIGRMNS